MERDSRRDRGQWRGCHSFKDIICDGDEGSTGRRDGGLKMGHTYYYYYELDGATETHDPSLPSTTACPYLPGQPVNTMWVPVEQATRKRSASLNFMNRDDFKTMNPDSKFLSPRPAPSPPSTPALRYTDTAPGITKEKRSARSLSPARWTALPRKLFNRKRSASSLRDVRSPPPSEDESTYKRSMTPASLYDQASDSLRRFLADEPVTQDADAEQQRPAVIIPEDIVEENEDDANFATSAGSEVAPITFLSPPPSQRSYSPSPPGTITAPTPAPPAPPRLERVEPRSHFSFDSNAWSPQSPDSTSPPPFYHSDGDEDDGSSARDDSDAFPSPQMACTEPDAPLARSLGAALSTYSLPRTANLDDAAGKQAGGRNTMGAPVLLTNPIPNAGLDELVSELGWMAGAIGGKFI